MAGFLSGTVWLPQWRWLALFFRWPLTGFFSVSFCFVSFGFDLYFSSLLSSFACFPVMISSSTLLCLKGLILLKLIFSINSERVWSRGLKSFRWMFGIDLLYNSGWIVHLPSRCLTKRSLGLWTACNSFRKNLKLNLHEDEELSTKLWNCYYRKFVKLDGSGIQRALSGVLGFVGVVKLRRRRTTFTLIFLFPRVFNNGSARDTCDLCAVTMLLVSSCCGFFNLGFLVGLLVFYFLVLGLSLFGEKGKLCLCEIITLCPRVSLPSAYVPED